MALSSTEMELIKAAMNLGGLFVVFMAMLYLSYRLILHAGPGFVKYAAAFIAAQEKQAAAITEVKDAIRDYVTADNNEHREILLGLQVLAKMMEKLEKTLGEK